MLRLQIIGEIRTPIRCDGFETNLGATTETSTSTVGITAARLKRMQSIRKKLRIRPENLTQIQDLAGCRVIVPSIDDVKRIAEYNVQHSSHTWFKDYDYISSPKKDGYRCFHRVFKFKAASEEEASFKERRVEIQ